MLMNNSGLAINYNVFLVENLVSNFYFNEKLLFVQCVAKNKYFS